MVLEERLPGLRRRFAWPRHVLGDGGFGNVMAQQIEFRLNARRTPGDVFFGHALDQSDDLSWDRRASRFASRFPAPELPKAGPVPAHDGFGFDDDEPRRPVGEKFAQADPKGQ